MKISRVVIAVLVAFGARITLAQEITLSESYTASNGITILFPEGYSASEQEEGDAITLINNDESVTCLFLTAGALSERIAGDLDGDILLAIDVVQASLAEEGNNFDDGVTSELLIYGEQAIAKAYVAEDGNAGAFLLFTLENGERMLLLATARVADITPDITLLTELATAVTVDLGVPRTEGNLGVMEIGSGMQLTFELPEGWGLADIEQNPVRTALVGAFADTATTNATIIDLSRNTDPIAFFNEQVTELAASTGHTDFSLDTHIVKGVTNDGFPISYYESAQFVEPATDATPSVWVALVEVESGHYVFLRGQSAPRSNLSEWSGQVADIANTFALRPAFALVPVEAKKIECSIPAYDLVNNETPTALVACPSDCLEASSTVWGSDIYTDDSAVCLAAIHAGVMDEATGGAFTIEWLLGQSSYKGTTANGITTAEYGSWGGSFVVKVLGD